MRFLVWAEVVVVVLCFFVKVACDRCEWIECSCHCHYCHCCFAGGGTFSPHASSGVRRYHRCASNTTAAHQSSSLRCPLDGECCPPPPPTPFTKLLTTLPPQQRHNTPIQNPFYPSPANTVRQDRCPTGRRRWSYRGDPSLSPAWSHRARHGEAARIE